MLGKDWQLQSGEVPLRTKSAGFWGSFGSKRGDGSPPSISALIGEAALIALLVAFLLPAAAAAAGGASPDPPPSGGTSASIPRPDPSPHSGAVALPAISSSSHTSSSSSARPVVSTPPPVRASYSITPVGTPALRTVIGASSAAGVTSNIAPSSLQQHARPAPRTRHSRRAIALDRFLSPLGSLLAKRRELGSASSWTALAPAVARHGGVWLLLSAIALAILVIASLSLLRLVRLNGKWWEGRTS